MNYTDRQGEDLEKFRKHLTFAAGINIGQYLRNSDMYDPEDPGVLENLKYFRETATEQIHDLLKTGLKTDQVFGSVIKNIPEDAGVEARMASTKDVIFDAFRKYKKEQD